MASLIEALSYLSLEELAFLLDLDSPDPEVSIQQLDDLSELEENE